MTNLGTKVLLFFDIRKKNKKNIEDICIFGKFVVPL